MTFKNTLSIIFIATALVACSDKPFSSSSTSTSSAYSLPSELELAKTSESSDASFASSAAFSDTGSDYAKHFTDTWLNNNMDVLDTINVVLQIINDSGYKDFVNKGPYRALIVPPGGDDNKSSGSDSSGSKVEKLTPMTVNITRADFENSPMNIDFWIDLKEDGGPNGELDLNVKGHIEVSKSANDTSLPWGVFTFDVEGSADFGEEIGVLAMFQMGIKTIENADGLAEMEFIDTNTFPEPGMDGPTELITNAISIHVIANKDLTAGNMKLMNTHGSDTSHSYVTFNQDFYIQGNSVEKDEYSKKFSDLKQTAFDYAIFNKETGAALNLNAGMPFRTADGKFGYAGNWGIWAESQNLIVDGAQITSEGSNPVTYTVVSKNGKLVKHSQVSKTLGDISGLPLYMWNDIEQNDKVIKWNSASNVFEQVGTMGDDGDGNWALTAFELSDYVTLTTGNTDQWDGTWVESLRTYLEIGRYINGGVSLSDSTAIQYYVESTVKPGDTVPSPLYTLEWVPDFKVANADALMAQEDAHYSCWDTSTCLSSPLTFDTNNYTLKNDATEIVSPDKSVLDLSESRYIWGVHLNGLVAATDGESHGLDTFYSWNTGGNDWNKFTSIKDAVGSMVAFDQPIRMTYKHLATNDRNYAMASRDESRDDMLYQIEYDGTNLSIPWFYNPTIDDWEPQINLKDGAILTDGTTKYVVKASDVMLTMKKLVAGGSGLTLDITTSSPTITYNAGKISAMPVKPTLDKDGTALKVKVSKGKKIE